MRKINLTKGLLFALFFTLVQNSCTFGSNNIGEISGIVFEDSNNNSILDPGEKGIPGILVSNQHEIVATNKKGKYTIPVKEDETIIFVIKPAGYTVPLNEYNLPQFYYIHKPEGSPDLVYGGIMPTGDLPDELNFPMQKTSVQDTFQVLVMADPQTRTIEEVNYLRDDIAAELIGIDALFSIALGDIMFDDLSLFDPYNATLSMIDIPMYNVPGNHDFDHYPDTNLHSLETFKKNYGPAYYAFEYGRVSFVVLNSVIYMKETPGGYGRYIGGIDTIQLQWLNNYLEYIPDEQMIVLCTHVPFHSLNSTEPQEFISNRSAIFNLVRDRKHLLAINGHLHSLENFYFNGSMGWTGSGPFQQISCATACGSWWKGPENERGIPIATQLKDGTPNGYHIFSFSGNTYQQKYKAAGMDENYQIRISSPSGIIDQRSLDSIMITVNFFNGNDRSEVTCQIDNSESAVLKRTKMKDPFAEELYTEHTQCYTKWMSVDFSNHIWTGKLPDDIEIGMHKIIVYAKDEYGNAYSRAAIFEVK